jgi:cell division septation protein DedD
MLSTHRWAVQVAALADRKDADAMALGLRNSGYDAYVMTSHVDNKTWHRVRVGQFASVKLAKELRETLVAVPQFKQAYVAAN